MNLPAIELIALHKHWCVADAVRVVVDAPIGHKEQKAESLKQFDTEFLMLGERASAVSRISVWYALLQVVVEGYQELKPKFAPLDELLSKVDYVQGLRRFRNATFHFQEDPLSDKILAFLDMQSSEVWIHALNDQFGNFFLERLHIFEKIDQVRCHGISDRLRHMARNLPWAPMSRRD
ncbi:MAG: hypothetical protein CVU22_09620 [Betaproteobacteria bacterium HGW-Betaproteobacteria-16]|nr:MAG: hypothetical protein CVU22_09620 [Betaproteobacteria bacterium HGW-Betaproteobacteria-16]